MTVLEKHLEWFNGHSAVVNTGSSVVVVTATDTKEPKFLKKQDFLLYYQNITAWDDKAGKSVFVANKWLFWEDRNTYSKIVFDPSNKCDEDVFNLWVGLDIEPMEHSGDLLYWQFVLDVICDGKTDLYEYTRKWMAHAVQKPWELPETALVLRGKQGIGKGTFVEPFSRIFGRHSQTFDKLEQIVGKFNGSLESLVFVFADEALFEGDRKNEGALKSLITSPRRTIEKKGIDPYEVDNFVRLVVASNRAGAVRVDADDRRFVWYNVPSNRRGDRAYFRRIRTSFANGGFSKILFDLLNEDISSFDPRNRPSGNAQLGLELGVGSLNSVERFILFILENPDPNDFGNYNVEYFDGTSRYYDNCVIAIERRTGGYRIESKVLYDSYRNWCSENGERYPVDSVIGFGKRIWNKLLPGRRSTYQPRKGEATRKVWIIPTKYECRNFFNAEVFDGELDWSNTLPSASLPFSSPIAGNNSNVVSISDAKDSDDTPSACRAWEEPPTVVRKK